MTALPPKSSATSSRAISLGSPRQSLSCCSRASHCPDEYPVEQAEPPNNPLKLPRLAGGEGRVLPAGIRENGWDDTLASGLTYGE